MKKTNILLLGLFALSFLFLISMVSAANTVMMNYPNTTNANRIGGTINLNASLDTNSFNVTNMSFYRRANTDTGAWTLIGSTINTSAQQTLNWVLSFATTSVIDDRNHEFNVTAYNKTGSVISTVLASNISIDNGVPTVTFSSSSIADNENRQPSQVFTIGIDADSTIGIMNCTIAFDGGASVFLAGSGNACSDAALTDANWSLTTGIHTYTIRAFDDNGNSTLSSSRQLAIAGASSGSSNGGGGSSNAVVPSTVTTTGSTASVGSSNTIGQSISNFFSAIANFFRNLFN